MEPTKGIDTSEFKVTVMAIVTTAVTMLVMFGVISQSDADMIQEQATIAIGAITTLIGVIAPAIAYIYSRTAVKTANKVELVLTETTEGE